MYFQVIQQFPKYGLYAYGEGEGKHLERLYSRHHMLLKFVFVYPG